LRDLLHRAAQRPPSGPERRAGCHDERAKVLFDVEMDGARYQLLRSAAPASSADADELVVAVGVPAAAAAAEAAVSAAHQPFLSPREREIVRMVALGHPNKTMAAVLEISCWTVGTYLRRIFAKLNVGSRAAMVARLMGTADLTNGPLPPSSLPRGNTSPSPRLSAPAVSSPSVARFR
jgi:DNA-binding CsgD family transcriptional regulator